MNSLVDMRTAIRTLLRSPGFSGAAILSLALAIAANTIVFGVLSALVLRPLPVSDPAHLFFVQPENAGAHPFPLYRELRDRATLFSGLAAYRIAPMALEGAEGSQRVWGYLATGNYFDVLGLQPALGRFFHAAEDRAPLQAPYAVLSYAAWRSRFGGDPDIIGRTIRIKKLPFTVLGVAAEGFRGTEVFYVPDIWVPMMMQPHIEENGWLDNWRTGNTSIVGRTKDGVTSSQAAAELNAIAALVTKEPRDQRRQISLTPPGLMGDRLRKPVESFSLAMLLLAGLVLAAASVNLATMFVVRSLDRMHEIGIKLALGAARGRLARELTFEVLTLAFAGSAVGLALANAALNSLAEWRIPVDVPFQVDVRPDASVLIFAIGAASAAGVLAALAPLVHVWRADPNASLRRQHFGPRGARWPLRDVLLAVQVACCCVLMTAGVVSVRGLAGALMTDVGMDTDRVTVAGFDLGLAGYTRQTGAELQQRVLEKAAAIPGVSSVALGNSMPLYIDQSGTTIYTERAGESSGRGATYYQVTPGYFRTLGIRMIRGSDFSASHHVGTPRVAVVNETLARQIGTTESIGWRIRSGCATCDLIEVIGIVADGKYETLAESPRPAIFFPLAQSRTLSTVVMVRSDKPQSDVAPLLRDAIHQLDRDLPLYSLGGLDEAVAFVLVPAWAATIALNAFGVLAAVLVMTGVYGVAAYSVTRRTREIGIRAALGAHPWQIVRSVIGRSAAMLAMGSTAGLALGAAASRILEHVVYQATPRDPVVIVCAVGLMCMIGIAGGWVPVRRALRIDPVRALREE